MMLVEKGLSGPGSSSKPPSVNSKNARVPLFEYPRKTSLWTSGVSEVSEVVFWAGFMGSGSLGHAPFLSESQ